MRICKYLIFIFLLTNYAQAQIEKEISGSLLSSEAPSIQFEQLGLQDGLEQSSANNIMQDSNGFIRVATQSGLHRYNGYEFEVFTTVPFDSTSLSESWVLSTAEAENGDLWITTMGGGLNRLDPNTGKAVHYRHDPEDSASLSSDFTVHTYEARNGDLWVSTLSGGLSRMLAGQDGKFKRYPHVL